QSTSTNAILLRDTPDKIAIAEQIISSIDKAKPEVVVEATVLEVDRNQLRELGILPPTTTSLSFIPPGTPPNTTPASNSVTLRDLPLINSGNFAITIPTSVATFLATSNKSKLLQSPQVRASDNKQAQLRIGSRVPVAQGSIQPTVGGIATNAVVQFQYIDIG